MNPDRHDEERRDLKCPCGSVASCLEDDDGCFRGVCRNGHEVRVITEDSRIGVRPACPTCED